MPSFPKAERTCVPIVLGDGLRLSATARFVSPEPIRRVPASTVLVSASHPAAGRVVSEAHFAPIQDGTDAVIEPATT